MSERSTVWLDSVELQDWEPDSGHDSAPLTLRSQVPPAPPAIQGASEPAPQTVGDDESALTRAPASASAPAFDLAATDDPPAKPSKSKSKGEGKTKTGKKGATKKERRRKKAKAEGQSHAKKPRASRKK